MPSFLFKTSGLDFACEALDRIAYDLHVLETVADGCSMAMDCTVVYIVLGPSSCVKVLGIIDCTRHIANEMLGVGNSCLM